MRHPKRAALALAVAAAAASTLGFNSGQPTALGATGQWITNGSGNWSDTANWNGGTIPNAMDDVADFSTIDLTTAATAALDVPVTLGTLTFGDTNTATPGTWTIQGPNALTLAVTTGVPVINVNDLGTSGSVTIGSGTLLSGNQGLLKLGVGTLILNTASSSLSGGTIISGGTLQVGTGGTFGFLGSGDVVNNGALIYSHADPTTFNDSISGTGSFTKAGTGTLSFNSSNNSYTGNTTINGGAIAFNNTTSFASLTNNSIQVNSGGAIANFSGAANDATFVSKINAASSGTLIIRAPDAATNLDFTASPLSAVPNMFIGAGFGDNVIYTGTITPAGNTYRLGGGLGLLQIANPLTGATNNLVVGPTVAANGGTVLLQSNNTYGGTTTINNGSTLQVGGGLAFGTLGAGDVIGGTGSLTFNRTGTYIVTNNINVGNINLGGGTGPVAGSMTTTGTIVANGALSIAAVVGNIWTVNGGSVTANALSTVNANGGQFILQSGSASFAGGIRGGNNDAPLIRVNGGTFNASDVIIQRNRATGAPSFAVGFIFTGGTGNIGSAEIGTNNSNGDMSVEGGSLTSTGPVTIGMQNTGGRGGVLRVIGGTFNVNDTAFGLVLGRNPTTMGNWAGNAAAANNGNQVSVVTFSGGITTLGKISMGYDANTNAGSATVNLTTGTLYLGAGGIVKNSSGTASATVNLTNALGLFGASADSTSSSGITYNLNAANLQIKAADASNVAHNMTWGGTVQGTGSILKLGDGILDLQGTNSTTAATFATVNAGTLAGKASSLRGTIVNNATVGFSDPSGNTSTFTGVVNGTGSVVKFGAGTSMINSGQLYSGPTTVNAGVLGLAGALTASSGVTVNNSAGLLVRPGGATVTSLTFGATGTDAQTFFANSGAGLNTLTTTNLTTNGTTTIDIGISNLTAGTKVLIDYSGSIAGSGFGGFALGALPPRLNASLVDDVANTSVDLNIVGFDLPRWIGNVSGTWDINTTPNWKTVTGNTTTTYLQNTVPGDQVLFDDAPLTNAGTGNVLLPGTVQPSVVTFNNNALDYTLSGAGKISGVTPFIKNGTGTTTISNTGGNEYTGGTTVNAGTLQIGVANALPAAGNITVAGGTLDINGQTITQTGNVSLTGGTIANGTIVKPNGNYDFQSGVVANTSTISGTAGVVKSSTGTVIILGSNHNYTGLTVVNGGVLQLGDGVTDNGTVPTAINNQATVDFNPAGQQIWLGTVNGTTGTVIKDGSQELIVNTVNDGNWVINNGQVTVIGPGGTSIVPRIGRGGSVTVNNGALLLAQGGNGLGLATANLPPDFLINSGGTIKADAGADLTLYNGTFAGGIVTADPTYASLTFRGDYTVAGSTSSTVNAPGNLALFNAVQFTLGSNSQLTISSNLTNDTSGMVASGPGTLILTGNNTAFPGQFTASAGGTIVIGDPTNLSAAPAIGMNNGTFRMSASISDTHNVILTTAAGGTLDTNGFDSAFSGSVTGTGNFTKAGAGVLLLNGTGNAWTGATNATGGRMVIDQTPFINTTGVTVSNNAVIELTSDGSANKVIRTAAVTVSGTAKVDIHDNKMIVTGVGATGSWTGSNYTGVQGLVASGRSGNTWTGSGIVTSQSTAVGGNFTTIGVALASDVRPSTATATGLWAGQTITGTDTLVMYTYGGDATLDGKINVDDYIKIDSGIAAGLTGWSNGDFNYDGKVNIDDYTQFIDANIGTQGPQFPSGGGLLGGGVSGVSAVPEPATISIIGLAALGALRRKRRRAGQPARLD